MRRRQLLSCLASLAAMPAFARRAEPMPSYADRDDAMRFAEQVAAQQGLPLHWVRQRIAKARYVPSVARLIMPAAVTTAKNWNAYRARFIEPTRIRAGVEFWERNAAALARAERRWGVPAELVVGIVGVETIYGRQMGDFRVIDALATLSFDFPAGRSDRSGFFRDELATLLVLASRDGFDPLAIKGSYAGAVGMGQFMPSSWSRYAVDFDGDGRIDLANSGADVIGSVAHYLASFGWTRGMPTHYEVVPPAGESELRPLLEPDIVPSFTAGQFAEAGALLSEAGKHHEGPLALVELQNGDDPPSYIAGTSNFYVVTRYNWSSYYARAVIELGEAVRQEREAVASR